MWVLPLGFVLTVIGVAVAQALRDIFVRPIRIRSLSRGVLRSAVTIKNAATPTTPVGDAKLRRGMTGVQRQPR